MQDEKSQLQNRERAMKVLRARLYEQALAEQQAALSADRKSQVGTGERAEKIRTYNYGERRVTDHRIKLTQHNLEQVLEGELDELHERPAGRREASQARRAGRRRARLTVAPGPFAGTTVREALDSALIALRAAKVDTPELDAEVLLAHALGIDRTQLFLDREREVTGPAVRTFRDLVRRRTVAREPVAYLVGHKGFRHLDLAGRPARARPAPGDRAARRGRRSSCRSSARVVDVGTGSGAIALALKHERPDLHVTATDVSEDALAVARANAERLELDVTFACADLFEGDVRRRALQPAVHRDGDPLPPDVAQHEPHQALFGGDDGTRRRPPARRALRGERDRPAGDGGRRGPGRRRRGARRRRGVRERRGRAATSPGSTGW